MTSTEPERRSSPLALDPDASAVLREHSVVHDLDRSGHPHLLVKVPDLEQALGAEGGIEVERESDGCIALSVLLYDIPSEPVSYDLRFYPDLPDDLRFLRRFLESAQFRLHPCQQGDDGWEVGAAQTFRLPPNVLLRLKHFSCDWPPPAEAPAVVPRVPEPPARDPVQARGPDPRDTVIRKLKEQVDTLREQLQDKDKRIIELEDELHEIKSRGRTYRLSGDGKPWWKPF